MDVPKVFQLLLSLGLERTQAEAFLRGESIVYGLKTQTNPGIGMIEQVEDRLRSGIIDIRDVGNGQKSFFQFRDRSMALAIELGVAELELFGGALINERLEAILLRHGYAPRHVTVPDDLGGGTMAILAAVQMLSRPEG